MCPTYNSIQQTAKTIAQIIKQPIQNAPVQVNGWIRNIRKLKKILFIHIYDGTNADGIQIVYSRNNNNEYTLDIGSSICATGTIVPSCKDTNILEIHVTSLQVIGECPSNIYPIQKKYMKPEYLREYLHLR